MKNNIYNDINYFESEYYKIQLYENIYKDKFFIYLEYNNNNINIIVDRIDIDPLNGGWGQNLKLIVRDKILHKDELIVIGSSNHNTKMYLYKDNVNKKSNVNHYENNLYKIFYISYKYNDIFKINYNEETNILTIKRLDDPNTGWGDNLKLKYIEKNTEKEKIINIGPSNLNSISIKVNIDNIPYREINNYYESNNYIITLYKFKYLDTFIFNYYEDNNTLYVKRTDSNEGWGAKLMLNIYSIKENYNYLIYVGTSVTNEIYKKIDLKEKKCYVALSTIPSRIKLPIFLENIKSIISEQTYPIEKIYLTISKKYKRFNETIDNNIIEKIRSISKIEIIIEDDYGPASKYLGPLINKYEELKDNILIIIDDDRKYNKNMIKHFVIGYNSNPNITYSSGLWEKYFSKNYNNISDDFLEIELYKETNINKFYYGNGLGGFYGFALKVNNLDNFIKYNLNILKRIPNSFYHDEGIILGYLKYNEEIIMYLNHKGCNFIKEELIDALCNSNIINRGIIEKEILQITNLEKL
jgi:hypothetical protein